MTPGCEEVRLGALKMVSGLDARMVSPSWEEKMRVGRLSRVSLR